MSEKDQLSERLQGIADSLTVRIALLIAQTRVRLNVEQMDEIRLFIGTAVRGAAIEGARNAPETKAALIPVPKVGRAHAQELALTKQRDTPTDNTELHRHKLPGGV